MVKILEFLGAQMETPQPYGWFHLLFVGLTVALTIFLCIAFRNCGDKTFRRIILIFWIVIVLFEIYKQINFTFTVSDGKIVADYQWYIFPFQFCSTPFYTLPFIVFLKDGKLRDAFIGFASIFALVAGIAVMALPTTVFVPTIGIDIQTMVHHGSQIAVGVFCCVHERKKYRGIRIPLSALGVFAVMAAIASIMNETFIYFIPEGETFNMFFISSHFGCDLPVLQNIQASAPYPVFLLAYFAAFGIGAAVVYLAEWGIIKLTTKSKQ